MDSRPYATKIDVLIFLFKMKIQSLLIILISILYLSGYCKCFRKLIEKRCSMRIFDSICAIIMGTR